MLFQIIVSPGIGGAERQFVRLVNGLGSECKAIVINPCVEFTRLCEIEKCETLSLKVRLKDPSSWWRVAETIRENGDDDVNIFQGWLAKGNILCLLLGLITRNSITLCFHRSEFSLWQSTKSQGLLIASLVLYRLWPRKVFHLTNSKSRMSKIVKWCLRQNVIQIDNTYPRIQVTPRKYSVQNRLLVVARNSPEKQVLPLVEELSKYNVNAIVRIVGRGWVTDKRVMRFGEVSIHETQLDLKEFYEWADFTVISSRTEASPNNAYESLSYGTPIICTPVGDLRMNLVGDEAMSHETTARSIASKVVDVVRMCMDDGKHYAYIRDKQLARYRVYLRRKNGLEIYREMMETIKG